MDPGVGVESEFVMQTSLAPVIAALLSACALAQPAPQPTSVRHDFGKIPLYFEPNQGQTDSRALYFARTSTLTAFIGTDGLTLGVGRDAVTLRIEGTSSNAQFVAESPVEGVSNYYVGSRSIVGVPHYSS